MWHGKGHLPPWSEVRQVAGHAIDDALRTHSIEQLIDIVRTPCREAGLRAARNKHDKNAHLKREYHNMVMDLLAGEYWLDDTTAPCSQLIVVYRGTVETGAGAVAERCCQADTGR
jgi:hypothetical protein